MVEKTDDSQKLEMVLTEEDLKEWASQPFDPDTEFEAELELYDSKRNCSIEGIVSVLEGETDAQCAERWRKIAYELSEKSLSLINCNEKLKEAIHSLGLQLREYEDRDGTIHGELLKKRIDIQNLCEKHLGASCSNGNYSFKNGSLIYTIIFSLFTWEGRVKESGSDSDTWLTGGRYADVFAKDQILHFIHRYKD